MGLDMSVQYSRLDSGGVVRHFAKGCFVGSLGASPPVAPGLPPKRLFSFLGGCFAKSVEPKQLPRLEKAGISTR